MLQLLLLLLPVQHCKWKDPLTYVAGDMLHEVQVLQQQVHEVCRATACKTSRDTTPARN
jgi:hypothetical protein